MTKRLATLPQLDSQKLIWDNLIPWVQREGFEVFFQYCEAGYGPQAWERRLVAANREKKLLLSAHPHRLPERVGVSIHGCVKLKDDRTATSIRPLRVHSISVPNITDQRYLFSYFTERASLGPVEFLALLGGFVNWSYPEAPIDLRNFKQREANMTTPVVLAGLRAVDAPNWVYDFIIR